MRYLIVGLGNIGEAYARNRHNIGFITVDYLASKQEAKFIIKPFGAIASVHYEGHELWLLKPATYMNESGKAVRHWLRHLAIPLERLLVITDDLHLSFGDLRIKLKGGSGGHNGLKSIAQEIQSTDYARLKFGIGNEFPYGKQAKFVLSDFTLQEQKKLLLYIIEATQIVLDFCKPDIVSEQ